MVGVPGRSKACKTCLKRRIKCDEGRPFCERCRKVGYDCGGYARDVEFRTHVFTNDATPRMLTQKPVSSDVKRRPVPMKLALRPNSQKATPVPDEICLIAFRSDMQFAYFFQNFVWTGYGTPWLELAASGKLGSLSLSVCQAFSSDVYGKHHRLEDIQFEGQIRYGQAVRALSSKLSQVGKPGTEALIVPIMVLLMHASTIPDPQAAFFHAMALQNLVQVCGPEKFRAAPLRQAFESCRATLFTIALISETATFLDAPEWKHEPWSCVNAPPKSPQNEVVDMLVAIPGLVERMENLARSPEPANEANLLDRLQHLLEKTYDWRWTWQTQNADNVWEVALDDLPSGKIAPSNRPSCEALWFTSFTHATEIALYNALLLCILGLLWRLEPPKRGRSVRVSQSPLLLPGDYCTLYEPAEEICRIFEFQLLNVSHSQESALFWLLPLGLASKVLEDDPECQQWIKDLLDQSYITRGYGTGNNSYGYGNYKFPKIGSPRPRRHSGQDRDFDASV